MLPVKKMIASAVAGSLMLASTAVLAAPSGAAVSSSLRVGSPVNKAENFRKRTIAILGGVGCACAPFFVLDCRSMPRVGFVRAEPFDRTSSRLRLASIQ